MHEPTAASPAAETSLAGETTEGPGSPEPPAARLLDDPRVLQILTTEHWSLLSARSLAYNEAFTRAGMFLTARAGPSPGAPQQTPSRPSHDPDNGEPHSPSCAVLRGPASPSVPGARPRETCRCIAPLSIDADSAR